MKFRIAAAVLASTIFAAPAFAAPVTGGRVEAVVGYDRAGFGDFDTDGFLYGLGVGYDFGMGTGASLGVDAELTDSTVSIGAAGIGEVSADRDFYIGARVTGAVSPTFNVYGKLGYTNARIKFSDGTDSFSENGDGIRAGIGGQFAVGPNAYIGSEYRYSNYEGDFDRHQVVANVGFRF